MKASNAIIKRDVDMKFQKITFPTVKSECCIISDPARGTHTAIRTHPLPQSTAIKTLSACYFISTPTTSRFTFCIGF
jgi:hypothetical protein